MPSDPGRKSGGRAGALLGGGAGARSAVQPASTATTAVAAAARRTQLCTTRTRLRALPLGERDRGRGRGTVDCGRTGLAGSEATGLRRERRSGPRRTGERKKLIYEDRSRTSATFWNSLTSW